MKNNRFIGAVLTVMALSYTPTAISAPKEYQKLLMDEPASLLDLMIFKADLELERHLRKSENLTFINPKGWDWLVEPKNGDTMSRSVNYVSGFVDYDYDKGNFIIGATAVWPLYSVEEVTNPEYIKINGKIKNNQKNISSMCIRLLGDLLAVSVSPLVHAGYSTTNTRGLPIALNDKVIKDTEYRVKIQTQRRFNKYPYLTCSKIGIDLPGDDNVSFTYHGDWHKIDDIEKSLKKEIIEFNLRPPGFIRNP
jgi:hypothetical protein